jgi:hypothetical protein
VIAVNVRFQASIITNPDVELKLFRCNLYKGNGIVQLGGGNKLNSQTTFYEDCVWIRLLYMCYCLQNSGVFVVFMNRKGTSFSGPDIVYAKGGMDERCIRECCESR